MNTQTIEPIQTTKESAIKIEYSLSELAVELAKDIDAPDIEAITINLFYRVRAGDFDFLRLLIFPPETRKILKTYDAKPYSEEHGGVAARLHNKEFNWLGDRLKHYHDYDNGIKIAIREICVQNFFYGKNIIPDYEEMLQNKDFVLDDEYSPYLELSEKQCKYLLNKNLNEEERQNAGLVRGKYSEWYKTLPKEYFDQELVNKGKLPLHYMPKEALIDYMATPANTNYFDWKSYPIFFEDDKSKHITTISKEFADYHIAERDRFIIALSKHLFISKEDLLHWLRLGRNRFATVMRSDYAYTYPVVTFLGNIWENTPFVWNPYINDTVHLSLRDAWKYYSDSHLWALYADSKARIEGIFPVPDSDKAGMRSTYENSLAEVKAEWLEHFRRGNLKMIGSMKGNILKDVEIDANKIEGLLSSNRFDFENNEIIGGDITGIKIFKVATENLNDKRENGYSTMYLDLMQEAINHFQITELNQPMKETLVSWFNEKQPDISGNIKDYMATMVRLPEMQKGGYYTGSKKKGNTHKCK